jgi:hypothetical protein
MRNSVLVSDDLQVLRKIFIVALAAGSLGGCLGAAPWDRDLLAERAMAPDTHPTITAFRDHIYFSKEGSSGGRTTDGGGCGCN